MSIQEHLNKIRNAIKGSEVRESIAKGIETAYDDASEKDNANMEVKIARGQFPNLRTRLDEVDNELEEVDNKQQQTTAQLAQKVGGGNKAELEDLSSTVLSAIEGGEGTSFDLLSIPQDRSVTPEKTTFADDGKIGGLVRGLGLAGPPSTGTFEEGETRTSYVAKVPKGGTYTIRAENSPLFRLATNVGYPIIGEKPTNYRLLDDSVIERTITLTNEEDHIILTVSNDPSNLPTFVKIQEGTEIKDGVEIDFKEKSIDGSSLKEYTITPDKTSFARAGIPLSFFEGVRVMGGVGNWYVHFNYPERYGYYIAKVEPNTTYTLRREGGNRFRVFSTDSYPYEGATATALGGSDHGTWDGEDELTVTTDGNARYLIYFLSNNANDLPTYTVLQEGTEIKDGVEIEFQDESIPLSKLKGNVSLPLTRSLDKNIGLVTDHVSGNYEKNTPLVYTRNSVHTETPYVDVLYSYWDDLAVHSPDYITKELTWNEPVENLPVYKYRFSPPKPSGTGTNDLQPIRILIVSNIHGHETYAALSLINLFNDIVKEWQSNDVLRMLRWNVQFDVFPIYNPYGFQHYSRTNGNGIDLNGNLPADFSVRDEPGSQFYSGTEPLSEVENQKFDEYLDNLSYSYDFALDLHHNGAFTGSDIAYTRTENEDVSRILFGVANQMNGYLKENYPHLFEDNNDPTISMAPPTVTGSMFKYLEHKKIPGTLHEIMFPGDMLPQDDAIEISITHIVNILLSVVRNIDSLKIIE